MEQDISVRLDDLIKELRAISVEQDNLTARLQTALFQAEIIQQALKPDYQPGQMVRVSDLMYSESTHPGDINWRGRVVKLNYYNQSQKHWEAESAELCDWIILKEGDFTAVDEAQS